MEKYFEKYFPGDDKIKEIVKCESNFIHEKNGEVLKSYTNDYGIMQINQLWLPEAKELGLDIFKLEDNIKMGKHILDKQGYDAWVCNSPRSPKPPQNDGLEPKVIPITPRIFVYSHTEYLTPFEES